MFIMHVHCGRVYARLSCVFIIHLFGGMGKWDLGGMGDWVIKWINWGNGKLVIKWINWGETGV